MQPTHPHAHKLMASANVEQSHVALSSRSHPDQNHMTTIGIFNRIN